MHMYAYTYSNPSRPDLPRPIPRPTRTIEEQIVFMHKDLPIMSIDQLQSEATAVATRIAMDAPHASAWLFDRLAKVRALLPASGGATQ